MKKIKVGDTITYRRKFEFKKFLQPNEYYEIVVVDKVIQKTEVENYSHCLNPRKQNKTSFVYKMKNDNRVCESKILNIVK